jgi:UDP-glucose 4-epimerase
MVIPTFIKQALRGEPITIFGDGNQSRCFGYVKDVTWALHKLMEHPSSLNNIYNIGSTEKVTMNELADLILEKTNSQSQKLHIPYQQAYKKGFDDAESRYPDISKIQSLIGFAPQHTLADIISITVEHMTNAPVTQTPIAA